MEIDTYQVTTGMGRCQEPLPFLSDAEQADLDSIGYSGKTVAGVRNGRKQYLNSLGKGHFDVTQTKFDNGSFIEEFIIVRVH